jgi:1-deoxy-D-xylulose-5-phosphate reductoisomerase
VDPVRYPAVPLAYAALEAGGSAPAVLNAANEVAVAAFLAGRIRYRSIVEAVGRVLTKHLVSRLESVDAALEHDAWARREAEAILSSLESRPALRLALPA